MSPASSIPLWELGDLQRIGESNCQELPLCGESLEPLRNDWKNAERTLPGLPPAAEGVESPWLSSGQLCCRCGLSEASAAIAIASVMAFIFGVSVARRPAARMTTGLTGFTSSGLQWVGDILESDGLLLWLWRWFLWGAASEAATFFELFVVRWQ